MDKGEEAKKSVDAQTQAEGSAVPGADDAATQLDDMQLDDVQLDEFAEGPEIVDAESADAAEAADAAPGPEARIAELEEEVAALKNKLMRAAADVQNTLKRADRERRDAETYGGLRLARDIAPIYDNLAGALSAVSDTMRESDSEFIDGLELTRRNLLSAFEKNQIKVVDPAMGDRFDPNRHQAMFEQPTNEAQPGSVASTMQVGFTFADRLIRPALVGVATAAPEPSDQADDSTDASDGTEAQTQSASESRADGPNLEARS